MLVLSRKVGEQIVIAENVTVTVLEIRGGRVRLGIQAPADVPVHRREVARQLGGRSQIRSRQLFERT